MKISATFFRSIWPTSCLSYRPSAVPLLCLSVRRPSVCLPACPLVRRSDTVSAFCSAFYLFRSYLTAFLLVAGLSLMGWSQPATVLSSVVWGWVCAAAGAILESTTTGSVALSPSCPVCVSAIHGHLCKVVKMLWLYGYKDINNALFKRPQATTYKTSISTDRDCCAFAPEIFVITFPRIPFPEIIKLRIRCFFLERKNSCRTCHWEFKCRHTLWL